MRECRYYIVRDSRNEKVIAHGYMKDIKEKFGFTRDREARGLIRNGQINRQVKDRNGETFGRYVVDTVKVKRQYTVYDRNDRIIATGDENDISRILHIKPTSVQQQCTRTKNGTTKYRQYFGYWQTSDEVWESLQDKILGDKV